MSEFLSGSWILEETNFSGLLTVGALGKQVKRVQEWLNLHDTGTGIDGDYGPATRKAVAIFQSRHSLLVDGEVGSNTYGKLTEPLRKAISTVSPGLSYHQAVINTALQHLSQHPREVGGPNTGPWVRLYMRGYEGRQWPWCAGAVSFILHQAAQSIGALPPLKYTFSVDMLVKDAKENGKFVSGKDIQDGSVDKSQLNPGSIFVIRKNDWDWIHTGLVTSFDDDTVATIEGNAQPLYSKILTHSGWVEMGDIEIGDKVVDPFGEPSVVVGVFPQGERDIYRLHLSDDNYVDATSDHLWVVGSPHWNEEKRLVNTKFIFDRQSWIRAQLPEICPPDLGDGYLKSNIRPYVLGLMLGDGGIGTSQVRFTTEDECLVDAISCNYEEASITQYGSHDYNITFGDNSSPNNFRRDLDALGLRCGSHDKRVPREFLWSNVESRLSLLRGILDTDGHVDERGRISFSSCSIGLVQDVEFLVQSLGGHCGKLQVRDNVWYTSPSQPTRTQASTSYRITIRMPVGVVPFSLGRKAARCILAQDPNRGWPRYIRSVEKMGREEAQCIKVSATSSMYVTDNFVPTHNTNDAGHRDGYEMCRRIRSYRSLDFISV